jgi:hypothetical protein
MESRLGLMAMNTAIPMVKRITSITIPLTPTLSIHSVRSHWAKPQKPLKIPFGSLKKNQANQRSGAVNLSKD